MGEKYKLAQKTKAIDKTIIRIGDINIGDGSFIVIAGPCAVESQEQIINISYEMKESGANMLRGGVFKPRTSPYDFQGLGMEGIQFLLEAKDKTGLPVVTEITDASQIDALQNVDVLQIGTRNMQNYSLLKEVGQTRKPVILKRGFASTIEEFLLSAEYILMSGNENVILCERGLRTFQQGTRYLLDFSSIPIIKEKTHLPIIVDPSHAAGRADLVGIFSELAMVAGADGIIVEVHNEPSKALCDGKQALSIHEFNNMMKKLKKRYEFEMTQHA